jgi:diaminopimelate epimerase
MHSPTRSLDWETDPVQLTKHHGLANDFLVALDEVNGRGLTVDGELARRVCDRRLGVGADGLIHGARPGPEAGDVDVVMHLYNADGSRAEMSGNGIRCLAQAVALARDEHELHLRIATDGGVRQVSVTATDDEDQVAHAEAHMGKVRPGPEIPADVVGRLSQAGPAHGLRLSTADVGNPHLVVEVADPAAIDLAEVGPWIEACFAQGINVEFAAARPGADDELVVDMRVWERGAGITEACGTGACATASIFQAWNDRPVGPPVGADPWVTVHMPGGAARVRLQADGEAVLTGPVHHVATIELPDA